MKNSGIYWVVDIIESETNKQIEHRKADITSLVNKKRVPMMAMKQDPTPVLKVENPSKIEPEKKIKGPRGKPAPAKQLPTIAK